MIRSPLSGSGVLLRNRASKLEAIEAYLFLFPALIGVIVFRLYPIGLALIESLYDISFFHGKSFVGLANYRYLFEDPVFWSSLKTTLHFNLLINPIQIGSAIALALLINGNTRTKRIFRTIYMLPLGVSLATASTIWRIMLNPNDGLVNSILNIAGISKQPFLTSSRQAIWAIILIASWKGISYWMIFVLAGLQEIPGELYEASCIDGASKLQQFWHVTLPQLRRVILFITVATTSANFLMVVPIFMLTSGGPKNTTNTLMFEAYSSAFVYLDTARAMALTSIILGILLIIVFFQFTMLKEKD